MKELSVVLNQILISGSIKWYWCGDNACPCNAWCPCSYGSEESGRNVKEAILKEIPTDQIDVMELDLRSMASVRKFASEYTTLGLPLNILM
jgi:WW domain-containing oxidoreductase